MEGPEETFRERNPYIIDFDQVRSVSLEVDEYWSEKPGQYAPQGTGILTQDRYKDVYWRYDFYLNIDTTHPYAGSIRYQMNARTTVLQVPNEKFIFVRRGLGIGGEYQGTQIKELIARMEQIIVDDAKTIHGERTFQVLTDQRPDSILERLLQDGADDNYLRKIDNMTSHVKRAARIARLLGQA